MKKQNFHEKTAVFKECYLKLRKSKRRLVDSFALFWYKRHSRCESVKNGGNMSFAENLKKVRTEKKLTQEQFAELLSVSRQAVSKWESGD